MEIGDEVRLYRRGAGVAGNNPFEVMGRTEDGRLIVDHVVDGRRLGTPFIASSDVYDIVVDKQ